MTMMNAFRGRDKGTVPPSFHSCCTRPDTFQSITFLPFFSSTPPSTFLLLFFSSFFSLSLSHTHIHTPSFFSFSPFQWIQWTVTAPLLWYSSRLWRIPGDSMRFQLVILRPFNSLVINCSQRLSGILPDSFRFSRLPNGSFQGQFAILSIKSSSEFSIVFLVTKEQSCVTLCWLVNVRYRFDDNLTAWGATDDINL